MPELELRASSHSLQGVLQRRRQSLHARTRGQENARTFTLARSTYLHEKEVGTWMGSPQLRISGHLHVLHSFTLRMMHARAAKPDGQGVQSRSIEEKDDSRLLHFAFYRPTKNGHT